jgi:hypothetical protein
MRAGVLPFFGVLLDGGALLRSRQGVKKDAKEFGLSA